MIKQLTRLANHLDSKGLRKEADYLDAVIKKMADDPKGLLERLGEFLKDELTRINEAREDSKIEYDSKAAATNACKTFKLELDEVKLALATIGSPLNLLFPKEIRDLATDIKDYLDTLDPITCLPPESKKEKQKDILDDL